MKNFGTLLKIAVIALFLAACHKPQEVVILHTNDTHSQLEPYKEKDGSVRGGVLRRMEFIQKERAENETVFLFDAGDFSQGTPYYNLFEGYPEIDFMNRMGYDAATLGNHEFDEGTQHLAERLKTAKFPIVCCNYTFDNPDLAAQIKPYTIIERNGMNWIHVSDLKYWENEVARQYGVNSIPANFLVDCSNGTIIATGLRGNKLEQKIAELLK